MTSAESKSLVKNPEVEYESDAIDSAAKVTNDDRDTGSQSRGKGKTKGHLNSKLGKMMGRSRFKRSDSKRSIGSEADKMVADIESLPLEDQKKIGDLINKLKAKSKSKGHGSTEKQRRQKISPLPTPKEDLEDVQVPTTVDSVQIPTTAEDALPPPEILPRTKLTVIPEPLGIHADGIEVIMWTRVERDPQSLEHNETKTEDCMESEPALK